MFGLRIRVTDLVLPVRPENTRRFMSDSVIVKISKTREYWVSGRRLTGTAREA